MIYFYARVSTKEQSLDRQLILARERFDVSDENVFCDKASGKDFSRSEYDKLKGVVRAGDEVIVKEFDRFGRNKAEMKQELEWFRQRGIIVRILDIPTTLIDFKDQTWVLEMVNNILIEVLGTMAEQERDKSKRRQREGIDAMKIIDGKRISSKTGKAYGRPQVRVDGFEEIAKKQKRGLMTVDECCKQLGISRAKWYRLMQEVA